TKALLTYVRRTALHPGGSGASDGQLLEAFVARWDDAAFAALVRRHGPMVLSAACSATSRTLRIRFRRRSWCLPNAPRRFSAVSCWATGCTAWRIARPWKRGGWRRRGGELTKSLLGFRSPS